MDGSDLNSPARDSENDSVAGDAVKMGGESGESSGSLDDDDANQFEDPGVEDAPTEPTGQAPQLPPSISESVGGASRGRGRSTATSSNNRRHTSTHMTPISRPRN